MKIESEGLRANITVDVAQLVKFLKPVDQLNCEVNYLDTI